MHTFNHLLCTHSTIYYALQPLQAFKRESERESVQSRGSRSLVIIDYDMSYSRLNICLMTKMEVLRKHDLQNSTPVLYKGT